MYTKKKNLNKACIVLNSKKKITQAEEHVEQLLPKSCNTRTRDHLLKLPGDWLEKGFKRSISVTCCHRRYWRQTIPEYLKECKFMDYTYKPNSKWRRWTPTLTCQQNHFKCWKNLQRGVRIVLLKQCLFLQCHRQIWYWSKHLWLTFLTFLVLVIQCFKDLLTTRRTVQKVGMGIREMRS